jgi:hypothetical protein
MSAINSAVNSTPDNGVAATSPMGTGEPAATPLKTDDTKIGQVRKNPPTVSFGDQSADTRSPAAIRAAERRARLKAQGLKEPKRAKKTQTKGKAAKVTKKTKAPKTVTKATRKKRTKVMLASAAIAPAPVQTGSDLVRLGRFMEKAPQIFEHVNALQSLIASI